MSRRRRRSLSDTNAAENFLALQNDETGAPVTTLAVASTASGSVETEMAGALAGANQEGTAHPFWSQRAQDEVQLQALRPVALTEIERASANSGAGSGSTELRPDTARIEANPVVSNAEGSIPQLGVGESMGQSRPAEALSAPDGESRSENVGASPSTATPATVGVEATGHQAGEVPQAASAPPS